MLKLIVNTYGEDKPGLVSDLSGIIYSLNGNILESKMVRLENIFTIIMAIEIPKKNKSKLEHKIKSIEGLNSTINILDKFDINKKSNKFIFSLECLDSEGIINHFTNFFNKHKINIEELNTTITNAPTTGSLLFNLDSVITVPENFDLENLNSNLELLSGKYNVTYKLLLLESE